MSHEAAESINESPCSPTQYKVFDTSAASAKLLSLTNDTPLADLSLDYLNATTFSDLYVLDRVLGAGTFGVVVKAVERNAGRDCAIKVPCCSRRVDYPEVQPA